MAPKKICNYTREELDMALESIRRKELSFGKAAKLYNIPKSTLVDRITGKLCTVCDMACVVGLRLLFYSLKIYNTGRRSPLHAQRASQTHIHMHKNELIYQKKSVVWLV